MTGATCGGTGIASWSPDWPPSQKTGWGRPHDNMRQARPIPARADSLFSGKPHVSSAAERRISNALSKVRVLHVRSMPDSTSTGLALASDVTSLLTQTQSTFSMTQRQRGSGPVPSFFFHSTTVFSTGNAVMRGRASRHSPLNSTTTLRGATPAVPGFGRTMDGRWTRQSMPFMSDATARKRKSKNDSKN